MNNQSKNNNFEIDLHGYTADEAVDIVDDLVMQGGYEKLRIIVGKGSRSEYGPVLPNAIKSYLNQNNIRYGYAPWREGGEGALDVYLP